MTQEDLEKLSKTIAWEAPVLVPGQGAADELKALPVRQFYDQMPLAIEELYDIAYPQEKDLPTSQKSSYGEFSDSRNWPYGVFVYYPWSGNCVRFPVQEDLRALRTSRNRNLITATEQAKLYDATILIAGMSVGSNIVEALVSMGIGGHFILADMDSIEPSNLNRIRAPYHHVGVHKCDAIAMRMSEIDPYLKFTLLRDGLHEQNLLEVLDQHQPTIIIDEMDQLKLKILLRQQAQSRGVALLSAADDGDSALLDIERYDLDRQKLFNGLVPQDVIDRILVAASMPRQLLGMLIGKYFVGSSYIPLRMFESLAEVGKTLPSWPQLGGAATQSGVAVAYAVRRILLNQPLHAGRFVVGPDQVLQPGLEPSKKARLEKFQKGLDELTW